MRFKIQEIKEKRIWEDFLLGCSDKTFLSSWNWGEFNEKTGSKIWRLGVFENDNLISTAQIFKTVAKRGTFLFLPHGPSFAKENLKYEVLKALLQELRKIAEEEKASFIRIAPVLERNEKNTEVFKKLGFKNAPIHMHPEVTWELNIQPSEEELLMEMRKTTRYLIRQGLKNPDLKIEQSHQLKDVELFDKLYQETVDRHRFIPFSSQYLKNEFLSFSPDNQISIFLGKYKNEIISSAMIIFWQGIAFYHQGASSFKHPKIPASYLLQWEAIKEAKRRGCRKFNFWGIAPEGKKNHPWVGLTLFKMGFGGYKKEYIKTQDLSLTWKYWLIFIFEKLRKIKRGF